MMVSVVFGIFFMQGWSLESAWLLGKWRNPAERLDFFDLLGGFWAV